MRLEFPSERTVGICGIVQYHVDFIDNVVIVVPIEYDILQVLPSDVYLFFIGINLVYALVILISVIILRLYDVGEWIFLAFAYHIHKELIRVYAYRIYLSVDSQLLDFLGSYNEYQLDLLRSASVISRYGCGNREFATCYVSRIFAVFIKRSVKEFIRCIAYVPSVENVESHSFAVGVLEV